MACAKSGGSGGGFLAIALRVTTVVLSVASAVTMASAAQPTVGYAPASICGVSVSYSDYNSFKYALAVNVICAALQAAAAAWQPWLKANGCRKEDAADWAVWLANIVDTAAQVFLFTSSVLSFFVGDFGSCGGKVGGVCSTAGKFCRRVRLSGAISLSAGFALSWSLCLEGVQLAASCEDLQVICRFPCEEDEHKPSPGSPRGCSHRCPH